MVYLSIFTKIVVSVVGEDCNGFANLPTANNSKSSLYKPIVVMYGLKYELVTNPNGVPIEAVFSHCMLLPENIVGI